jgi:putative pyruvate formate lyase activating enzyme
MKTSIHKNIDFYSNIEEMKSRLSPCVICPFRCGIDRSKESTGRCRSGYLPKIASYTIHHGEEPPISGSRGSGTIFLSSCPMRCVFCQNYPISQLCNGYEITISKLAEYMLLLQRKGAHNINLVTPTHFAPQIVEALHRAHEMGLEIPTVYNSSGYEDIDTLRLLEGVIDIYLPDMKYGCNENAERYSGARNYVEINQMAIREMYRQVGNLAVSPDGVAKRGLLIRHLALPENISCTEKVLEFIATLDSNITVSLMNQYFPAYKAVNMPVISRKLTRREYEKAAALLERFGISNGWTQEL